jgi:hypothetical protein
VPRRATSLDAPQDDALPLPLEQAQAPGAGAARVRADQPARHLRLEAWGTRSWSTCSSEGFDLYLLDWGVPDEEDRETGLDYDVCDALPWRMREAQRSSGSYDVSLVGWCTGGAPCALRVGIEGADSPARNLVLLTTPVDTSQSLYTSWVGRESYDVDYRRQLAHGAGSGCGPREQTDEAGNQLLNHE